MMAGNGNTGSGFAFLNARALELPKRQGVLRVSFLEKTAN
jgi:hypothetical protein